MGTKDDDQGNIHPESPGNGGGVQQTGTAEAGPVTVPSPAISPPAKPLVRPFLIGLVFLALGLTLTILLPFINPILLAVILASLVHPVYSRLEKWLGGRKNFAALITVIGTALVIVLPIVLFIMTLVAQASEYVVLVTDWVESGGVKELLNHPFPARFSDWLRLHVTGFKGEVDLAESLLQLSRRGSATILEKGAGLIGTAVDLIADFFVMIFLLFFLVRDGRSLVQSVKDIAPLREEQENRILSKIRLVARATLLGTFVTALLQGLTGGIGMSIVGIPGVFWGTLMGIASLIPVVGTGAIGIPAVGYLLISGRWQAALFLGIWLTLLVGTIDNFLRPILMHGKAEMSTFVLFLGIIGGLAMFGLPGLLYGPLIMGFTAVMLYIFRIEYAPHWR
jgi:predicted PurR-regulated permease PerM